MVSLHRVAQWYRQSKNKWWALPLVLPCLFFPLVMGLNAQTLLDGGRVFLLYLPLALMTAFVMLFGWRAFPGITLALLIRYVPLRGDFVAMLAALHFLIPLAISWGCYHAFVPRRKSFIFDMTRLIAARIFWLVWVNGTLYLLFYEAGLLLGFYDRELIIFPEMLWTVRTLINYQSVLVGCLTGLPFFYYLLRCIVTPRFALSLWSRMLAQRQQGVRLAEIALWCLFIALLTWLLLSPVSDKNTIFNTDYTLTLILPVMLWSSMRFGFLFTINIWAILLYLLSSQFEQYMAPNMGLVLHLAIASSCYAVFSITIYLMAAVTTRQRILYNRTRRLTYIDPVLQIPNLRALKRDLDHHSSSTLGIISIPELELLGRNYGVLLRIHYKQQLSNFLRRELGADESIYHISGYHLALRLSHVSPPGKIEAVYKRAKQFRFVWHGMPLQPQLGVSYCYVRSPVLHLYQLLGELISMAERSLSTFLPENLQLQGANTVQNAVKSKVEMMNRLQYALDNDRFVLMAQPIEGIRGDVYYEILLRMIGDDNQLLTPDQFLPVAHEFGLSVRIDRWAINATLKFMDTYRDTLQGERFSINITPASISRAHFAQTVKRLLSRYHIEPWQVMFELIECGSLLNLEQANKTLTALQQMGCRIAIDDFGTGYASYACLKELNADTLKIDGSLIGNILSSSLDYQVVTSICQLARIKKMQVVAEHIEKQEIKEAVKAMGIDYLQGDLIGEPRPLKSLLKKRPSIQSVADGR